MNKHIEQVEAYHKQKGIKVISSYPDNWLGPDEYNVFFDSRRDELLELRGLK